jgi:outer membrane protein
MQSAFLILISILLCPTLGMTQEKSMGLADLYDRSLRYSDTVAAQSERVIQSEERENQAQGGLFPNITGVASYRQQDPDNTLGTSSSTSFSTYDPLVKVTATQALFRGFREFAGLRQTRALTEAESFRLNQVKITLFVELAQNYYDILSGEQDRRNLEAEIDLYSQRIDELSGRVRIGRSRPSEVLTIEATKSSLEAQIDALKGRLLGARENLHILTGLPRETRLEDRTPVPTKVDPIENYLKQMDNRPDIKVAVASVEAADEAVSVASGAHLPSIDLVGNYYFKRADSLQSVNWDAQVTLTLPIFSGGIIQSQVRETSSRKTEAELGLRLARRRAEAEIRSLYESLKANWNQISTLARAKTLTEKNHRLQRRDYRLGLVNNIEVLQSLTASQQAIRAFDQVQFAAKLNYIRLLAAIGKTK